MVIELKHRAPRVRFKHPVRVVPLDGAPRIYRTLTANLSRKGMFVRMPEPLPIGTRVALSLEAGGQALPFAEAEIAWCRTVESQWPGRYPGFGVRFTSFLNPRAPELLEYLVKNLDRGRPLKLAPRRSRRRWVAVGAAAALVALLCATLLVLSRGEPASSDATSAGSREGAGSTSSPEEDPVARDGRAEEPPAARSASVEDGEAGAAVEEGPPAEPGDSPAAVAATAEAEPPSAQPPAAAHDGEAGPSRDALGPGATTPDVGQTPPASALREAQLPPAGALAGSGTTADVGQPPPAPAASGAQLGSPDAPPAPTARPTQALHAGASVPTRQEGQPASLQAVADHPQAAPALHRGKTTQAVAQPVRAVVQPASSPADPATSAAKVARSIDPRSVATSQPTSRASAAGVKGATPAAPPTPSSTRLALPSGALQAISWHGQATTIEVGLELAPGAALSRAFLLAGPPRLVLDLDGKAPRKSYSLEAGATWIEQVRLGPHGKSTRVVVDLKRAPTSVSHQADAVTLSFSR
ncbi:MAG: PilZ domain-containing protein [Myxococcota bacterium]